MSGFLDDPAVPIIAGHSHCTAIGVPIKTTDGVHRLVPLTNGDSRFCGFSGMWPRREPAWQALSEVASGRTIILVWLGNQHNKRFLLSSGRAVDFVLEEAPDLDIDSSAELIPDLFAQKLLAEGIDWLEGTIRQLIDAGAKRVIVSGTTPPKANVARIRAGMRREPVFHKIAKDLGLSLEEIPLASPLLMHKAWRIGQRLLELAATRQSVEFLPVPENVVEGGCLRDDLGADDATHGNEAFGRIMLDHFHTYLSRRPS